MVPYPILSPQEELEIPGGWGHLNGQSLIGISRALGGGGGGGGLSLGKILSVWGVWIFSGATH